MKRQRTVTNMQKLHYESKSQVIKRSYRKIHRAFFLKLLVVLHRQNMLCKMHCKMKDRETVFAPLNFPLRPLFFFLPWIGQNMGNFLLFLEDQIQQLGLPINIHNLDPCFKLFHAINSLPIHACGLEPWTSCVQPNKFYRLN